MGLDRVGPRQGRRRSAIIGGVRPRVALVCRSAEPSPGHRQRRPARRNHPGGARAVRLRVRDRQRCIPSSRPLVEWRRAPWPRAAPLRLQWAAFYATAAPWPSGPPGRDVVHAMSPMPAVPNRVDLGVHRTGAWPASTRRSPGGRRALTASRGGRRAPSRSDWSASPTGRRAPASPRSRHRAAAGDRGAPLPRAARWPRSRSSTTPSATGPTPRRGRRCAPSSASAPDDVVALHVGPRAARSRASTWRSEGLADAHRRGADRLTPLGGGHGRPRAVRHGEPTEWPSRVKRARAIARTWSGTMAAADIFVLPTIYEHGSRATRTRRPPAGCPLRGDRHPAGRPP